MPPIPFNLGKEVSLALTVDGIGVIQTLGLVEEFETEPIDAVVTVKPINQGGRPSKRRTHEGWRGSFTASRQNGALDAIEQYLNDNFYQGGKEIYAQFSETYRNQDGSIDRYLYKSCVLYQTTTGTKTQDGAVKQRFAFECPERVLVQ